MSYLNEITTSSLLAFSLQFTLSKSTLVLFLNNVLSTYTFFLEVQTTLCHHDCFATRTTRLNVLSSAGKLKYKDFFISTESSRAFLSRESGLSRFVSSSVVLER